jgi:membrane-bound serine protease (ClpP class)
VAAFRRAAVLVAGLGLFLAGASEVVGQPGRTVLQVELNGPVTPVMADHLSEAVERAEREGHEALLVQMDTPGGLDSSMRDIVKTLLGSRVPVAVWVGPAGARATSAGAVIALSAHVVGMAPGTNIGAATPVTVDGAEVGDKIVNDATAYVVAVAEERGRDADFARDIVRDGRSEPYSEAARLGVADFLASSPQELLNEMDGHTVTLVGDAEVELSTSGAVLVTHEMGWFASVRQRLADPNIAFLFMSLGTLAIIYELINPGMGFGGIIGLIFLLLGLFSLAVLPVNVVGVAFLILAAALFAAELFVPGVGVFAAGGSLSLALSAVFLMRGGLGVNPMVFVPTVLVVGGAVVLGGRLAWRARRRVSRTGTGALEGRTGVVTAAEGSRGRVFLEGSWWTVTSPEPLEEGQEVLVTRVDGLQLLVEPKAEEEQK